MKRTPLQWSTPKPGDLAVTYNGIGEAFYVLILEVLKEEEWPSRSSVSRKKKFALVRWTCDGTTGYIEVGRLKVV